MGYSGSLQGLLWAACWVTLLDFRIQSGQYEGLLRVVCYVTVADFKG